MTIRPVALRDLHRALERRRREMEREILAMCESEQMAVAPWEVLDGGRFKSAEQIKNRKERDSRIELHTRRAETFERVRKVRHRIAEEIGTLPTSVTLAYVMKKQAYVFPLVGGRKVEHLKANIEALSLVLRDEDVRDIEKASEWSPAFPYDVLAFGAEQKVVEDLAILTATFDYVHNPEAIRPRIE